MLFIVAEEREDFNLLLADLHNEFQPATAYEQILLEKMAQNQWLSLRAYRHQAIAMNATIVHGYINKDMGLLIRYHQSSDRGLYKAHCELLKVQKERKKSEIGFESQNAGQPAETPLESPAPQPNAPDPPQKTTPIPGLMVPEPPPMPDFRPIEVELRDLMNEPYEQMAKETIAKLKAQRKAA